LYKEGVSEGSTEKGILAKKFLVEGTDKQPPVNRPIYSFLPMDIDGFYLPAELTWHYLTIRRSVMEDVKRILVVSRDTKYCKKAVHYGVSLSRKYGAELYVIHVLHDPFSLAGWNLPIPSLQEEYKRLLRETREELAETIAAEKKKGMKVKEFVKEGHPATEIFQVVKDENIDLIILLAHEEGRLEHFLFGRSNEEIIRKMPCSILMVKKEPGSEELRV